MAPGARSKFGAAVFEPEVFRKKMYCIEGSSSDIVGTFQRPPQSSGALIVTRRPGNCVPLVTPLVWTFGQLESKVAETGGFVATARSLILPRPHNAKQFDQSTSETLP